MGCSNWFDGGECSVRRSDVEVAVELGCEIMLSMVKRLLGFLTIDGRHVVCPVVIEAIGEAVDEAFDDADDIIGCGVMCCGNVCWRLLAKMEKFAAFISRWMLV